MPVANVALTDTFDQWRIKTNQLIIANEQTDVLSRTSVNLANFAFGTANAAFARANTVNVSTNAAFGTANAAFARANTVNVSTNAAFGTANAAFGTANAAFARANTANAAFGTANAAFGTANAAFAQANTTNATAIAAFGTANAAFGTANAAFALANTANATAIAAFALANTGLATQTFNVANAILTTHALNLQTGNNLYWLRSLTANTTDFRSNVAGRVLSTDAVWLSANLVTLTDNTTITLDLSTGINFQVILGGNRTLSNTTNSKIGQTGQIHVIQDGSGSRALAFGSQYKFAGGTTPSLDTAISRRTVFSYFVRSSAEVDIYLAGSGVR